MEINKQEYANNLLFYTILKNLIKCKLTDNKMIQLETNINENKSLEPNKFKELISTKTVSEHVKAYEDYIMLINLCNEKNYTVWQDLTILSIELLLSKKLILEEAKTYAKSQYNEELGNIKDRLSLSYDFVNLEYPYGQRVISALLVYALTDIKRETEFILDSSRDIQKLPFRDKKNTT